MMNEHGTKRKKRKKKKERKKRKQGICILNVMHISDQWVKVKVKAKQGKTRQEN